MDKEILQPKRRKKSYRCFHDRRKNDIRKRQASMSSIQQQQTKPSTPQQQPKPTPPPKPTPTQQPKATPRQQRPKSTRSAVVKPTTPPPQHQPIVEPTAPPTCDHGLADSYQK